MDLERIAKWLFWFGVVLFVIGLPSFSLATPVSLFLPLVFTMPYLYIQLRHGMAGTDQPGPSEG